MHDQLISEVVGELSSALVGRAWGKIFQLSASSLAVDFRAGDGRYLFVSVEPNGARLHLVARTVRELEKAATQPSPFALMLRKALGGATLRALRKDEGERVVRFDFAARDAVGGEHAATLVAQLTGRTSNLFLLDGRGRVVDSLRPARGAGQEPGDTYAPPVLRAAPDAAHAARPARAPKDVSLNREGAASISEALDRHHLRLERERAFDSRASAAAARLRQEAARLGKLRDNLTRDLAAHGDADEHKRRGDLLLANIANAERRGRSVQVRDYFAEGAPLVEFEVDEHKSLQDEAARSFARYAKAKRAARELDERLEATARELAAVEERRAELERIVAARDADALEEFVGGAAKGRGAAQPKGGGRAGRQKKGGGAGATGARRYLSSDGYEILVGRGARDNDQLTFRVARSYDTWMHAADYPGSHVVVRARNRDDQIPHRTLLEAAGLAAHFSRARADAKVAVNYTQRKFITKPKGAAPGLVYLSSFRTLMAEPRAGLERI